MYLRSVSLWLSAGIFTASLIGFIYPSLLPWMAFGSVIPLILLLKDTLWRLFFAPKESRFETFGTFKSLKAIQKKRQKIATDKHQHINDQIRFIHSEWGYTKEQERTIEQFIAQRAYSQRYNKLTASLLPQLITLIEQCKSREKQGCKREVARRIRELTLLMREDLKKKNSQSVEDFETTLEVYDRLIAEVK